MTAHPTIGDHYRDSRVRLTGLLGDAGDADWARPVPACPGWDVHDVVAHLVAIVEDALAGRLAGPPSPEQTAEQVARNRDRPGPDLLTRWTEQAPEFERAITELDIWPAAFDVGAHEHDIRGPLGRPGGRDCPLVRTAARMLVAWVGGDATIVADLEGDEVRSGGEGTVYRLRTTSFEVFRLRFGRRTREQVAALDWSPVPPAPVLDSLFLFGPTAQPIVE